MIERWQVVPVPTPKDPRRHSLRLKAAAADLTLLVRRLGSLCGRPQKEAGRTGYNYSLYLKDLIPAQLARVEKILASLQAPAGELKAAPAAAPSGRAAGGTPSAAKAPRPVVPLDPGCTFDTLVAGPFNRFAHAAGTTVIANPGSMYNPLFLYGVPSTGKSALLSAIGRGLEDQKKGNVLFTTGPRLASAAASGAMPELEALAQKSLALLVDDVHLMAVSERNQAALARLLHSYLDSSKAVVMTSVYPPRVLGALEEALDFKLNSGWSVEMKLPSPDWQPRVVQASLARLGLAADDKSAKEFLERMGPDFSEMGKWMRRLRSLAGILGRSGKPKDLKELAALLFVPEGPLVSVSSEEIRRLGAEFAPPPAQGSAQSRRAALFFPKEGEAHVRYALLQLHATAAQRGFPVSLVETASLEYDPEQLYGIPFTLGEACQQAAVDVAVALGPTPGSGLASREGELVHALDHILEGCDVSLAWIPFGRVKSASAYFKALLDLYPAFQSHAG